MKKTGMVVLVFGLGLIVLFLSIVRVSLGVTLTGERENLSRKIPVSFSIKGQDGRVEEYFYYLPEIRTLPNSPWYVIKEIRDKLWLSLCKSGEEKVRLSLLLSDKKITEARVLLAGGLAKKGLEEIASGVEELKKTAKFWSEMDDEDVAKKQLGKQIYKAGLTYREVLWRIEGAVDIDQEKYADIMNNLNEWNEKQKETVK